MEKVIQTLTAQINKAKAIGQSKKLIQLLQQQLDKLLKNNGSNRKTN
jgi:hypothetical protein